MNENEFVRKDVHDAEQETLLVAINNANDRIDDLRDTVNERLDDIKEASSRSINLLTLSLAVVQMAIALVLYFLKK